ncbi:MAG: cadherin-like beta sandwich domain-containing protein [Candidatus Pristimantibacillus sp.]
MLIMPTKGLYWLMVVVLLMGAISVNFSTTAYAAVYPETIHEVPAAGGFKSPIIGGEFDQPEHVAVDLSGNVYVTDGWNGQVQKFDSNGNYLLQWGKDGSGNGEFKGPDGIAVDASGNVYVVDSFNDRIQKFDSSGNYLLQWGEKGSGNGHFDFAQGIAIDISGYVYVADGNNNRIQKFDSSGTYVTKWGGNGSGNGQLDFPQGIAVDNSGNVYVTDARNYRIQKFDSSGTYVTQWGSEGVGNGQFDRPIATAVDNSGNVYVVDSLNNRIQKFDSNGTYVTKWGQFGVSTPKRSSTATDSNGNVYVMDHINGRIQKFDSSGNYLLHWGKNGSGNGEFFSPQGIAVDASGNVYVADTFNNRIQKFDSSGTYVTQWGKSGSGHGKLNFPGGIAVDTRGNVYVADSANHRIQKFDSNGLYVTQWGSKGSGDGEFDTPNGIAVDTNGNVYVTDSNNNRIQKIDSKGLITQWGSKGSGDGEFDTPTGIAVDTSGNVYVTETSNNRIQMFNSSGTYVTRLWGSNFNGFNFPVGVTFDNSGKLYVLDMNGGIRKFSLNNNARITKLTFTGGTLSPSFTPDTTSYTASVATSVYAVTITPVLEDPMATVDVSGASGTVTRVVYNNVASFSVPLNVGENPIAVTAKAMDGVTKKIYTINVTRTAAISSNADLNSLALSSGSLNPMFVSGTTSYTASVGNSVSGITVTPTVADSSTTVKVNGVAVTSGSTSGAISLNVGGNTITVETTAQDGTTKKTYTVTVTRTAANSSNADLNSLALSSGSLNPAFASGTTSYTASVGNSVSSITVTPTVSDTLFGTVTANVYNSSGALVSGPITLTSDTASSLLPLGVGSNVVKIAVTAEDGLTTRIYSLTIRRATALTADSATPIWVTSSTPVTITVPLGVTNAKVAVTPVTVGSNKEAMLPLIEVQAATSLGIVSIVIPDGTKITGPANWDGTIKLPEVLSTSSVSINNAIVHAVIEVGSSDVSLAFDRAVRLLIPNQGDKSAGYVRNGVLTPITGTISADTQAAADREIAAGGDARITVGSDLVIWTKHFTKFVAYTPVTPTRSGGSGSGGGGGSGPSNNFTIAAFADAEFTLNNVKFSIPEGATDKTIRVTVDKVADISSLPKDAALQLLGDVYEVKKNSEGNFIKPVTIVLPFDVSKVDFNKNEVAVYWLNEQTSKWVVLDNTKVDQASGTVSGTVMHFGKFAVFTSERIQTPSPSVSELNLTDIKGHWAEARIRELIKKGAINGYPDQTFKPNNHITRAEFVSILVKAFKLTATISKTFTDTNGSWAEDSIGTAATLGIVSGFEDNTFRSSDLITREQMVAIVVRAVKLSASSKSVSFKDNSAISSWAIEDVAAATDKGLIDGYEDGTFRAKANTTRAEATAVILKAMALKK